MAGDSFRDSAWDNQLDTMLDDLQNSVQGGETHGYKNGYGGHTSREYQERQNGNAREVREKVTRTAGGPGNGFSYREESQFMSSSSSSHTPMGSKKAIQNGHMYKAFIKHGSRSDRPLTFPGKTSTMRTKTPQTVEYED